MNLIKYIFQTKRYFVFSFICGEITGYVEVITENHSFPSKADVYNLIRAKMQNSNFTQEELGSIVICNIFEFKSGRDFKQWIAEV
jgi:hypothetical protein